MDKASLGAVAIVAAVGGAGMYFMNAAHERQIVALQTQLAEAKQRHAAELENTRKRAEEAQAAMQKALKAAEEVRRLSDIARQKQLAAERASAELEARRTADIARTREAEAKRTADIAKQIQAGSAQELYEQAQAREREGNGIEAVRLYRLSVRAGSGKAALRLGDIFDKGLAGISPDYAESLKWKSTARALGEDVPLGRSR